MSEGISLKEDSTLENTEIQMQRLCEEGKRLISSQKTWKSETLDLDTYEVNSDSGDEALCVGVISETKQQARLSNSTVPNQEQLEEVIAVKRVDIIVVRWKGNHGVSLSGYWRMQSLPSDKWEEYLYYISQK